MTTPTSTHTLYNHLAQDLVKKVEKANRRAKRLGLAPYTILVTEAEAEPIYLDETRIKSWVRKDGVRLYPLDADGRAIRPDDYRARSTVTIGGATPQLPGGWEFVGIVTEDEIAGPMPKLVTDQARELDLNLSRFRDAETWNECEHCHTRRNRRKMFLLRSATGEIVRIGSTCIHAFLGLTVQIPMDRFGSILEGIDDMEGEINWGSYTGGNCYKITDVIALAYAVVKEFGWLNKENARLDRKPSTGERVEALLTTRHPAGKEERNDLIDSVPAETVRSVIEYARTIELNSEYARTLHSIMFGPARDHQFVSSGNLRILASVIAGYSREQSRKAEAERIKDSVHVGTVGKREVLGELEVVSTRWFDGFYGARQMVKFADHDGNILVWWNTGKADPKEGERYTVTAAVKEHSEYNGVKQTTITRCKLVSC